MRVETFMKEKLTADCQVFLSIPCLQPETSQLRFASINGTPQTEAASCLTPQVVQ